MQVVDRGLGGIKSKSLANLRPRLGMLESNLKGRMTDGLGISLIRQAWHECEYWYTRSR